MRVYFVSFSRLIGRQEALGHQRQGCVVRVQQFLFSFESSSHKDKPADVDVKTLQSRLATANASLKQKDKKIAAVEAEFERIFEALHHCQAELEQAKNTVKERDVLIGRLQAELAQGGCTCMRAVVFECTYKAVRAKQTKNIHQLLCTSKILR